MEPQYLHDNDPWRLAEDIPDIDFHFSQIWLSSFVNDIEKTIGINYKKILSIHTGYSLKFFYGTQDSEDVANRILDLLKTDPSFGQKINDNIKRTADELKLLSAKIEPQYLKSLSNSELKAFHQELDRVHTEFYIWGWLPNAVDMFTNGLTNYIKSELEKAVGPERVNEALVNLTTTDEKSLVQIEHESLLRLAAMKQGNVEPDIFHQELTAHKNKYFFVKHLWVGTEGYDEQYYINEIDKIVAAGENANDILKKEEESVHDAMAKRAQLLTVMNLDSNLAQLIDVYAEFAVTKSYRRDAQLFWAYQMDHLFDELAERLGVEFMQIRFMLPQELYTALDADIVPDDLKNELSERTKYCAYYAEKDLDKIYLGDEAKALDNSTIEEIDINITELTGQTACLGKATGAVRIINSPADMAKMEQGDILVSIATNPDIVMAMKKAAAIVTEQGGITSHAAIVSRELRIPCVIGTKIATKVLKDGDIVEVDADNGIVRIINQ